MKRNIFILLMALTLTMGGALFAQIDNNPTSALDNQEEPGTADELGTTVDQNQQNSGTATGQSNLNQRGTTGSTTGATGSMDQSTTGTSDTTGMNDQTTTGYGADQDSSLPATGSELPLAALVGLLAFGAAALLRAVRS